MGPRDSGSRGSNPLRREVSPPGQTNWPRATYMVFSYTYTYVCVCIYIYIYIYIHTFIYVWFCLSERLRLPTSQTPGFAAAGRQGFRETRRLAAVSKTLPESAAPVPARTRRKTKRRTLKARDWKSLVTMQWPGFSNVQSGRTRSNLHVLSAHLFLVSTSLHMFTSERAS